MMVDFKNENASSAAAGGAAGGSAAAYAVSGDPNDLFVDSDNENDD